MTADADTPPTSWTWLPVEGARCGNGSDTGLALRASPDASTTLLVLVQGGGACWEVGACYGLKTAAYVEDTLGEAAIVAQAKAHSKRVLMDRDDVDNPLRDAHQAFLPYCTGDLHLGTRVQTYEALGQTRDLHHVGALNMQAFADRLATSFPDATRVVLFGLSAGGYGALFNATRFQAAFGPGVRVDVLSDGGLPIDMAWDRFAGAVKVWAPEWPAGCDDCEDGLSQVLPFLADALPAPSRVGVVSFRQDAVIAGYFGLPVDGVQQALDQQKLAAASNQRFFLADGLDHVLTDKAWTTAPSATGAPISGRAWIHAFAGDDPGWDHAGP